MIFLRGCKLGAKAPVHREQIIHVVDCTGSAETRQSHSLDGVDMLMYVYAALDRANGRTHVALHDYSKH